MATHSSVLAWRIPGTGGAWWAAVSGVAQSRTQLKRLSSSSSKCTLYDRFDSWSVFSLVIWICKDNEKGEEKKPS